MLSKSFLSKPACLSSWTKKSQLSTKADRLLVLNDLQNIPGAKKKRIRVGRGPGRNGKTSGHGHQKSRSTPRAFEGGQTPLYKTMPKIGFTNSGAKEFQEVNLGKIQQFINTGRLVVEPNRLITIRDLLKSGVITHVRDGVKLLAKNKEDLKTPIHVEVSCASKGAIEAVEAAGGTVTAVHFNRLALRAALQPYKFTYYPLRARPPPKIMNLYLDKSKCGYLSPEIQIRNTKLFGCITSEEKMRQEHALYMAFKHSEMKRIRDEIDKEIEGALGKGSQ